jgi:hypothetical protein
MFLYGTADQCGPRQYVFGFQNHIYKHLTGLFRREIGLTQGIYLLRIKVDIYPFLE